MLISVCFPYVIPLLKNFFVYIDSSINFAQRVYCLIFFYFLYLTHVLKKFFFFIFVHITSSINSDQRVYCLIFFYFLYLTHVLKKFFCLYDFLSQFCPASLLSYLCTFSI